MRRLGAGGEATSLIELARVPSSVPTVHPSRHMNRDMMVTRLTPRFGAAVRAEGFDGEGGVRIPMCCQTGSADGET